MLYSPQKYVSRPYKKFFFLQTHRGRTIAASTALVKYQFSMLLTKFIDHECRLRSYGYSARYHQIFSQNALDIA